MKLKMIFCLIQNIKKTLDKLKNKLHLELKIINNLKKLKLQRRRLNKYN